MKAPVNEMVYNFTALQWQRWATEAGRSLCQCVTAPKMGCLAIPTARTCHRPGLVQKMQPPEGSSLRSHPRPSSLQASLLFNNDLRGAKLIIIYLSYSAHVVRHTGNENIKCKDIPFPR